MFLRLIPYLGVTPPLEPPLVCGNSGLRHTRIASCVSLPKKVHYRMLL
jgi:hypothetical protein